MILLLLACTKSPAELESDAILAVKDETDVQLHALADAAVALREAAPDAAGWSAADTADAEAAWRDARTAYERVEGAIAVLFPDLDASTDERYDGFLADGPDDYLFDAEGVRGVHAIERILWAGRHPDYVVAFESGLPYYVPAAFPADEAEIGDFRDSLCAQLVTDTATLRDQFAPVALDSAAAFRGVIGSLAEQREKVDLAASGEDESRYAQHTLGDMRANLAGGRATFDAFTPWLEALDGGALIDEVNAGFDRVDAAYDALSGDAVPAVPSTWNPDAPSDSDLATDYGQLWSLLQLEADPDSPGSLVERMGAAAELLGIPQIPE